MGTRSIIIITSDSYTARLYKHSDGYPTGVLPLLVATIKQANSIIAEHNARLKCKYTMRTLETTPHLLVGKIIGEASTAYGMGCYLEEVFPDDLDPKHLGNQCDLEWIYVINLMDNTLRIYGGGFTGELPQSSLEEGTVDPCVYSNSLKNEYQKEERERTLKLVAEIESLGFKINPKRKSRAKITQTEGRLTMNDLKWTFNRNRDNYGRYLIEDDKGLWNVARSEKESDAHLIAAAPEILEALKELIEATKGLSLEHSWLEGKRQIAMAIIRKARGQP